MTTLLKSTQHAPHLHTPQGVINAEAAILALHIEHNLPEPVAMHAVPRLGHVTVELAGSAALAAWAACEAVRVHPADVEVHGDVRGEAFAFIDDGVHEDGLHINLWFCESQQTVCQSCDGAGWQTAWSVVGDAIVTTRRICACSAVAA